MAQKGVQLEQETLSCSICLDLLKEPVTISCGHSYCMRCIENHWDTEDEKNIHSCPQCRKTFSQRPLLVKSTMLADVVEQLRKTGLQAAPADLCYAGPEEVACDFCTGRKLKALKSCLMCLASYCEKHLQAHYDVAPFKKHKLVEPSKRLQENICSRHDEVMKMFCRTDQQCICYLCSVDEHKGHDTATAAAERADRQRELELSRHQIQKRLTDVETDVKALEQEVEAIIGSADKAVEDSEETFTQLIRLMEKRGSEVKNQIRTQQRSEVTRVKELQEKLEQEMAALRRTDSELEQLALTEDHNLFLHNYASMSSARETSHVSTINSSPPRSFEAVTAAVSQVRDQIQDILSDTWTTNAWTVTHVDVLLPQPQPKTRGQFLKYARVITLDPNTVNYDMLLSKENRKATFMTNKNMSYGYHPDRFTHWSQALSRESLTGRCYWEVKWSGGTVSVAVAHKNISRAGNSDECKFGCNDKSLTLDCESNGCTFYYNNIIEEISSPVSSRIGVYLDHSAGTLSFYSVTHTMTLLHMVQNRFTQPLYAGVELNGPGDTAEFCEI